MKFSLSTCRTIVAVVLFAVAGCRGESVIPNAGSLAPQKQGDLGQLIYVAENDGTVRIYSYPKAKLLGRLTGFGSLYGDCADQKGDVFIVDYGKATVFEYARGGTVPIAVLHDNGYSPTGCSIDPTTGNVAVANFYAYNYSSGTVAIYAHSPAGEAPRLLTDPDIFEPRFCGYDARGNLYIDGYSKDLAIEFAVLPARSTQFTNITLNETIHEPGTVQWDGKYLAVGDASTNIIYQFSISGSAGTEMGSTSMNGVKYGVNQFWIEGAKVVGAAAADGEIGIWKYPAGGAAVKVIKQNGSYAPIGVAVSAGSGQHLR